MAWYDLSDTSLWWQYSASARYIGYALAIVATVALVYVTVRVCQRIERRWFS